MGRYLGAYSSCHMDPYIISGIDFAQSVHESGMDATQL